MDEKKSKGAAVPLRDYKSTLNLPQTDFSMRGSLSRREPEQIEWWEKKRIYDRMIDKNRSQKAPRFLLHDGPPYANGNIHMGHALNKVLKDVVIKYKNMTGVESVFIPGWDCHGLPIELGVEKQLLEQKRDKASIPVVELRALCRTYAQKYIELQKKQFQRLEVFADWDHPYFTMDQSYVAAIVRELGRCAEGGILYQGNKPVYWCPSCATALAEAEIEYADKTSPSVYVKFDLSDEALAAFPELAKIAQREGVIRTSLVIWTTTPWTLPSNLGVSLHPEFDYVALKAPGLEGTEIWIVAKELRKNVERAAGFDTPADVLLTFKAERLHRQKALHPFIERDSLIMLGEHVTLEAGTGVVHTAPGHGADDYRIGSKYGLNAFAPVDAKGLFTEDYPEMKGQFVFQTNEPIIKKLYASGHLIAREEVRHSYPQCWRCHQNIIFRATPQWFIGMDSRPEMPRSLRKETEKEIREVSWTPAWAVNRIQGMVEVRPDWCISRQRNWGVPITVFFCEDCNDPQLDQRIFNHVAELIEARGTDLWFTEPVESLMPSGTVCKKCGSRRFRKEKDILDVWFDSGVSHAAVCERLGLGWPADLYLEGSDQHRGWFQTSLLTAVATRGRAPFRSVLTHGFVNDQAGKKMSKSKGNVTSPLDLMESHGAELLRLWVVLEDYRNDVNFSVESLDHVLESYRKIRNTVRFLLGNLHDFEPEQQFVSEPDLQDLDRWALSRAADVFEKINVAYEKFEFHSVYQLLINFCVVDLSSVYFDILKDRLYTAPKNSSDRRSAQTALWLIASALIRSFAPILSFTAEEAWGMLPQGADKTESVFLAPFACGEAGLEKFRNRRLEGVFDILWISRTVILKALEEARQAKKIGHAREAKVVLTVDPKMEDALKSTTEDLSRLFLVSQIELRSGTVLSAEVTRAVGEKCERCWVYSAEVGKSNEHPGLCSRCVEALGR